MTNSIFVNCYLRTVPIEFNSLLVVFCCLCIGENKNTNFDSHESKYVNFHGKRVLLEWAHRSKTEAFSITHKLYIEEDTRGVLRIM